MSDAIVSFVYQKLDSVVSNRGPWRHVYSGAGLNPVWRLPYFPYLPTISFRAFLLSTFLSCFPFLPHHLDILERKDERHQLKINLKNGKNFVTLRILHLSWSLETIRKKPSSTASEPVLLLDILLWTYIYVHYLSDCCQHRGRAVLDMLIKRQRVFFWCLHTVVRVYTIHYL